MCTREGGGRKGEKIRSGQGLGTLTETCQSQSDYSIRVIEFYTKFPRLLLHRRTGSFPTQIYAARAVDVEVGKLGFSNLCGALVSLPTGSGSRSAIALLLRSNVKFLCNFAAYTRIGQTILFPPTSPRMRFPEKYETCANRDTYTN